jgi:hypothetical protein
MVEYCIVAVKVAGSSPVIHPSQPVIRHTTSVVTVWAGSSNRLCV